MENSNDKVCKESLPLYPIGIAAELVGTTDQTLRLYEKHGLVSPARRNKNRFYSDNNIKWLRCVRELIHAKKISIEGVKKLLDYAPCWDIQGCSEEIREQCSAFVDRSTPCWELTRKHCKNGVECGNCFVYLSGTGKRK
ncbi:MAG: MerR family transcriptional regulator [Nitrospirota bacterium]